jgi:hypothetical protein
MRLSNSSLALLASFGALVGCSQGNQPGNAVANNSVVPSLQSSAINQSHVRPDSVSENFKVKNTGSLEVIRKGETTPSCATVSPDAPLGVASGTTSAPSSLTFSGCTVGTTYTVTYGRGLGGADYECTFDATFNGNTADITFGVSNVGQYATCSVSGGHPEIFNIAVE